MKQLLLTITLSVALLSCIQAQAAPPVAGQETSFDTHAVGPDKALAGFTFDTDNMQWQQTWVGRPDGTGYDRLYSNAPADWFGGQGNPPGSILQTVGTDLDQRAYWLGYIGEPGFLGDMTGAYLSCDVYSTGNWVTIANGASGDDGNVYARWVISAECAANPGTYDMFVSLRTASIDLNGFTGWQHFSVPLDAANFMRWPNSVCGTLDFTGVLQAYDQVGLYVFSGSDNPDDFNGQGGTWVIIDGVYRLQHYGANATGGVATWGVDNFFADGPVADEPASFGRVKALFR